MTRETRAMVLLQILLQARLPEDRRWNRSLRGLTKLINELATLKYEVLSGQDPLPLEHHDTVRQDAR